MHREAICILALSAGLAGCGSPAGDAKSTQQIPNATTVVMRVEGMT